MTQATITITTGQADVIVTPVSSNVTVTPVVKSIVQAMPAGLKGDKGDTGSQGIQGFKGDTGIQGLKGDKGDTGSFADTFETVSKNLSAKDFFISYDLAGNLLSLTYDNGIVKTLGYTSGKLTSITLSGSTPSGIELTKKLTYTGDELTGVNYE
jgi:hypothetical protein